MSDLTTFQQKRIRLSQIIRAAMQEKHLNNLKLATLAGINEGTIRKMLKEDLPPGEIGPHPQVIKAICHVLDLDLLAVYRLLDYFPDTVPYIVLSEDEERLARRIHRLPADKKQLILDMLSSMEKAGGLPAQDDILEAVLRAVRDLRRNHPMFEWRQLGFREEVGHLSVRFTGDWQVPPMRDLIISRFQYVAGEVAAHKIDEAHLDTILKSDAVILALQMLMPRKDMPSPLEKLYWLGMWESKYTGNDKRLPEEYKQGLRALWLMLDHLAEQFSGDTVPLSPDKA